MKYSLSKIKFIVISGWTILIAVSFIFEVAHLKEESRNLALVAANSSLNKDQTFREWAATHGGVYVPITKRTPPNPALSHLKDRDLFVNDKNLTLMNPAYMLRQITNEYEGLYGLKAHITSLKLLNPNNISDSWEKKALLKFEKDKSKEFYEFLEKDNREYLRVMKPLITKKGCLKCHGYQGYKVGDVRGGISISVVMDSFYEIKNQSIIKTFFINFLIWLVGIIGTYFAFRKISQSFENQIRLHKKLKESEFYLKSMINSDQNLIVTTYGNKMEMANQTLLDFIGYKNEDEFTKDYNCICELFEKKEGYLQSMMGEMSWLKYILENKNRIHKAIIKKDNIEHIFLVNANILKKSSAYIAVFSDITEFIKIQQELKEKEALLITQSHNASMGEMISLIAHQWKQPLTQISMSVNNVIMDVELDEVNNDELKKISFSILSQIRYLSQTIDDFRDFFKPNKEKQSVVVNDLIDESLSIISKSLENSSIKVIKEYHSTTTISIISREFLQVVLNIIKNAKDALVENRVENPTITLKTYENNQKIFIEICDNGKGVKEEIIEKIFDSYFTTKDGKSGTGLGLYISKTIITKHLNGKIYAKNQKDGGVCFVVELNL